MHLSRLCLCSAIALAYLLPLPYAATSAHAQTVGTFTPILKASSVDITAGGSGSVGLIVESHGGFDGTVMVSLPANSYGITMAPVAVRVPYRQTVETTLRFAVAPGTPAGERTVSVKYDSGTLHKNWPLVVRIAAATPPAHRIVYGYVPPGSQTISGGASTYWTVPNSQIHQTSWAQSPGSAPNIQGNYAYADGVWNALQWRWADTMRNNAVTTVASPGSPSFPAYRFEIRPSDHASPGTAGDHPRAEFFSVDGYEARRGRVPPRQNVIKQGDEYWATWSMYLAADFPTNHKWATLFQRKFDNLTTAAKSWFSINAHGDKLDFVLPGSCPVNACDYSQNFISSVSAARGKWTTFTIHEKASTGADGFFELYVNGRLVRRRDAATIESAAGDYNFHYGYYRANEPMNSAAQPPGTGVVYFSPLMIARVTPINVPGMRFGQPGFIPVTP